jgi:hypothetical protein
LSTAERELETRQRRHLSEIGEWLAGGANPALRPVEPPDLLGAEQHLTRCRRDAAAARNVIGDHAAVAAEAAKFANELKTRRGEVLRRNSGRIGGFEER